MRPIVRVLPQYKELYQRAPWKVYYGGRGSGKSYAVADALLVTGLSRKCKILCAREFQNSIQDSVHSLLSERINALGLANYYTIERNYIKASNGTQFLFEGVACNIDSIRSIPGITHCWVEEAHNVSEHSWDVLIPTVREEGSEIWVTFNPVRDDDPTYKMLVINTPPGAIVRKTYYYDNPYLSQKMRDQAEYCKRTNPAKYQHIWLGEPIVNYDTLVYRWTAENEVTAPLPFHASHPVYCSWDFGTTDETAVIAWQVFKSPDAPNGCYIHIFDELVSSGKSASWYRQEIDKRPWAKYVHVHYCDPTGKNANSSLSSWVDKIGYNFKWSHGYSVLEMIDHANDYMPSVRINRTQTPRMFRAFRTWQYVTDKDGDVRLPLKPRHDEESHCGSAWYYGMINHFRRVDDDAVISII